MELFRNVNSTDVKIGAMVREHDLWMLEEKDGQRQDLFTETAFSQIGCSSPEVQLVRMIYGQIEKGVFDLSIGILGNARKTLS